MNGNRHTIEEREARELFTASEQSNVQLKYPPMRWVGSAVLLPIAAFSGYVGAVDGLRGGSLTTRLFGVALALAAAAMFTGTYGLFFDGKRSGTLALIGCCTAALVGLIILTVQLAGVVYDWRLAVWVAMVALPSYFALLLFRSGARARVVKRLQAALSVSVVVSLLQFWYTTQYVPITYPGLVLTASLEKQAGEVGTGGNAPLVPLLATVSAKNVGSTRARLLGSALSLAGSSPRPRANRLDRQGFAQEFLNNAAAKKYSRVSRFTEDITFEVFASKPLLLPWNELIEPGQELSYRLLFYAPKGAYEYVQVAASVIHANANRLGALEDGPLGTYERSWADSRTIVTAWRLRETSMMNRMTRGRRYVHAQFFLDPKGLPRLGVYIDRSKAIRPYPEHDQFVRRLEHQYGLFTVNANTEVAL